RSTALGAIFVEAAVAGIKGSSLRQVNRTAVRAAGVAVQNHARQRDAPPAGDENGAAMLARNVVVHGARIELQVGTLAKVNRGPFGCLISLEGTRSDGRVPRRDAA